MGYKSAPIVTRPANTTAYTAGDVVGGVIVFPAMGSPAGDSFITSVALRIHVAAVPSGMTSFRLHLYDATPASAIADNSPWLLHANDLVSHLGYIDLGTPLLPAANSAALYVRTTQINDQLRLRDGFTLYGYLVTNGGFTPAANSEIYVPELHAVAV
jgi:hypothetical protein